MDIVTLFPTAVGVFELGRPLSKSELNFIHKLEHRPNEGNETSADNYVFRNKSLKKIKEFCLHSAAEYIQNIYSPKHDISLYSTQSWLNYTKKNQYHHKHTHPNSFVSGVLFIQAEEETDKITFHKEEYKQICLPTENYNSFNSGSWTFPIKTGLLLIFPSSLSHSVPSVVSDKIRISLSFNTFLKGTIGDNSDLTELILT